MKDTHSRSFAKGVTWRLTAMMDTMFVAWLVTGSVATAMKIASIETFTKIFLFYLHERLWARIRWRRQENSHRRSLAKGVSWRVTGTLDTTMISWLITGHIPAALQIGGIEVLTKITLYYVHERLWTRIPWGTAVVQPQLETAATVYEAVQS